MYWKDRIRYWWRKRKIKAKYPKAFIHISLDEEMGWDYTIVRVEMLRSHGINGPIDVSFIRYMFRNGEWNIDVGIKHAEDFKKVVDIWNILVPDTDAIPEQGLGILVTM